MGSNYEFIIKDNLQPAIYSKQLAYKYAEQVASVDFEASLISAVEKIKEWAVDNNFLIGHIKLYTENFNDKRSLWLSTTGKELSVKESADWRNTVAKNYEVHLTVILFGVKNDILNTSVEAILAMYL